MYRIAIDAFGGDNAPDEILKGCAVARSEYGVCPVLVGRESRIREAAKKLDVSLEGMEIVTASSEMPVEADPGEVVKGYADSSLAVGLKTLAAGGADAFVTAGSTGAAVVGASLLVKRIKGIKRAALGTIIPAVNGGCYMLIDVGANSVCRPEMLMQFGLMGSAYMEKILGNASPRVGLVNIGAERTKGTDLHLEAYAQLEAAPVNFIGNVEARELPLGGCDVAVADGFVGNVVLKLSEGMGRMINTELKSMLLGSAKGKLAALLLKNGLMDFRRRMDYTEYGGAPLMGIAKPVIKAHGSSNANAVKNAIRQAKLCCENQVIETIQNSLSKLPQGE